MQLATVEFILGKLFKVQCVVLVNTQKVRLIHAEDRFLKLIYLHLFAALFNKEFSSIIRLNYRYGYPVSYYLRFEDLLPTIFSLLLFQSRISACKEIQYRIHWHVQRNIPKLSRTLSGKWCSYASLYFWRLQRSPRNGCTGTAFCGVVSRYCKGF